MPKRRLSKRGEIELTRLALKHIPQMGDIPMSRFPKEMGVLARKNDISATRTEAGQLGERLLIEHDFDW